MHVYAISRHCRIESSASKRCRVHRNVANYLMPFGCTVRFVPTHPKNLHLWGLRTGGSPSAPSPPSSIPPHPILRPVPSRCPPPRPGCAKGGREGGGPAVPGPAGGSREGSGLGRWPRRWLSGAAGTGLPPARPAPLRGAPAAASRGRQGVRPRRHLRAPGQHLPGAAGLGAGAEAAGEAGSPARLPVSPGAGGGGFCRSELQEKKCYLCGGW